MDNKWLRLASAALIGIFTIEACVLLFFFISRGGVANSLAISGIMPSGMSVSAVTGQSGLADIQRQLMDMKSMMSVGLPTAIALGLINLWRSYRRD